jgi:hypothetical protein
MAEHLITSISFFFNRAAEDGWRMNWKAWRTVILIECDLGVLDDDSGFSDEDCISAEKARKGFMQCTVGPSRFFKVA